MKQMKLIIGASLSALLLAACGGGSVSEGSTFDLSNERGALSASPVNLATLTPAQFQAAAPASLFQVAGTPTCSISFNYYQYGTVGGVGEKTNASGGIMVPSGSAPACQGPRPILLYAHGTTTEKNFNMASPQTAEAGLVAAMYAAQGYIVVAPNYAGYEASSLSYHPYLNADQQSKDMIDALTAARKALPGLGAQASSKLFVSGYSQGGHVAMATVRALQAAGTTVTASAPLSGPYNLLTFGDAVFAGNVNLGATIFSPLLTTSYQRSYGNIYSSVNDVYESTYANGIETLLPSTQTLTNLFATNKLPQTFLFSGTATNPQFAAFFGTPNLIKTSYRQTVLADAAANPVNPQNTYRQALKTNTLLNFKPASPMLLCGGNADPTVFYAVNTSAAAAFFAGQGSTAVALDVDSAPTGATDPFAAAKVGFATAKNGTSTAAGGGQAGALAVVQAYHGSLVPPFCNAAARGFFSQF
jgi:acetyl esterase/lipase